MVFSLLDSVILLLLIVVMVNTLFHRVGLPVVIGYILIGVIVGPYALGWISNTQTTHDLAEFGIVFLMFAIGLEFSLARLIAMKKIVFIYGGLQVLLSIAITMAIGAFLPMTLIETILVGAVVSLSSTAIVLKQLTDQQESHSRHGSNAIGILLFQDLAVIPLLILIPGLAAAHFSSLFSELAWALGKGAAAIAVILAIGRWVLRPIFYHIAAMRSLEMFTLTALLITLGSAWITHHLGLSLALGAFLAGIMLGETEFRHQIETDLRPFRDVLLGFFFISIGMQFDPHVILTAWQWILLMLLGLLVAKTALITVLGIIFKEQRVTALRTGLLLAQGGEFGFAILSLGLSYHILTEDYGQVVLGSILLSMILAPLFIRENKRISSFFFPEAVKAVEDPLTDRLLTSAENLKDHVIILGYGRIGKNIARFLEKAGLPYLALDLDAGRVSNATLAGESVCYADATQYKILQLAGIERAKMLVVSFDQPHSVGKILQQVRQRTKRLPIIVRCHDDTQVNTYYKQGATEVISEEVEASLVLASHVLLMMQVPASKVQNWITDSRNDRYDLLRMVYPGVETLMRDELEESQHGLHAVVIPEGSHSIGKSISELILSEEKVKVTTIRRGSQRIIDPPEDFVIQANDIMVLFGKFNQLESAEITLVK